MTTAVIGVGNAYRSDDGVGRRVADLLREECPAGVTLHEASGEGADLMDRWRDADKVILVDAAQAGNQPGCITRLDAAEQRLPSDFFHYSSHAFSVAEAVELARTLGALPPTVVVYGIEGKSFANGEGLTPEVESAAREAAKQIREELTRENLMHEASLMKDLMAKICGVVEVQEARRAVGVSVWLGALSHMSKDHFTEHYVEAARGTPAEGAALAIELSEDVNDPHAQDIMLRDVEVEL